jgi:hypothetical protein
MRHHVEEIEPRGPNRERWTCTCGWAACRTGRNPEHVDRLLERVFDQHQQEAMQAAIG